MHSFQKVQQRTRTPRLRIARIRAISTVLVRQLGKPSPRISLNILSSLHQHLVEMMERLVAILPLHFSTIHHTTRHTITHVLS